MIILQPAPYSPFLGLATGVARPRLPSIFFGLVGFAPGAVSYCGQCIERDGRIEQVSRAEGLVCPDQLPLGCDEFAVKRTDCRIVEGRWRRKSKRRRMLGVAWQTARTAIEVRYAVRLL